MLFCERHPDGRAKLGEDGDGACDHRGQLLALARLRGLDEEQARRWADDQQDRQAAQARLFDRAGDGDPGEG